MKKSNHLQTSLQEITDNLLNYLKLSMKIQLALTVTHCTGSLNVAYQVEVNAQKTTSSVSKIVNSSQYNY